MKEFRLLKPAEIDVRVQQAKENGIIALLYKDARCDMNILDEKFGIYGWQRCHNFKDGKLYCSVSVFDEKHNAWITKEDVGTESNTDAEKGQASDSFKRACVNLGIGRELYSSPLIWISSENCNIKVSNQKVSCYDKFSVTSINYDDDENISELEIYNETKKCVAFSFNKSLKTKPSVIKKSEPKQQPKVDISEPTPSDAPASEEQAYLESLIQYAEDVYTQHKAKMDYFVKACNVKSFYDLNSTQLNQLFDWLGV